MATFPPSPTNPIPTRLSDDISRVDINNRINSQKQGRASESFPFLTLSTRYPPIMCGYYNLMRFGHLQSARQLAQHIPAAFHASFVLDIGVGTGNTAIQVCQVLCSRGVIDRLSVVDGMPEMLETFMDQMDRAFDVDRLISDARLRQISPTVGDYAGRSPETILPHVHPERRGGIQTLPTLITSQRVLHEIAKRDHALTLRCWMALGHPTAKLMVDVPHPDRQHGIEWFGQRGRPGLNQRPIHEYPFTIADQQTWEECRSYARELAVQAGLIIEGEMIAQCPTTATSRLAELEVWIRSRIPSTWTGDITRDEFDYFRREYNNLAKGHHEGQGYEVQYDHAAVIVIFSRGSSFAAPASACDCPDFR